MVRGFLSLVTAFAYSLATIEPAYSQSVQDEVDQLSTVVETLAQRVSDLEASEKANNSEIAGLLNQVFAAVEAQRRTGLGAEQAKTELPATMDTANSAVGSLQKVQTESGDEALGRTADGQPLLPQMIECATKLRDSSQAVAANLTPDGIAGMLAQCDSAKVKALLEDLNRNREATIKAYQSCRDALIRGRAIFAENLPEDPTSIPEADLKTVQETLAKLQGLTDQTAACKDQISGLIDDVRNMDNSAAAMGAVMNMAATMCMASGANPYVCGAIFAIAILSQLFGGGDGDGDGDGKPGSGQGDPNGMGNLPASNGSGKETPKPVTPLPTAGVGGSFGVDPAGNLACSVQSGPTLVCSLVGAPTTKTTIDPKSVVLSNPSAEAILLQAITSNNPAALHFCSGAPSVAVTEINIVEGQGDSRRFISVGLVPDLLMPGRMALSFGPGGPLPNKLKSVTDKAALTKGLCEL